MRRRVRQAVVAMLGVVGIVVAVPGLAGACLVLGSNASLTMTGPGPKAVDAYGSVGMRGPVGSVVKIHGQGWESGVPVRFTWDGAPLATLPVDGPDFTVSVTIPSGSLGSSYMVGASQPTAQNAALRTGSAHPFQITDAYGMVPNSSTAGQNVSAPPGTGTTPAPDGSSSGSSSAQPGPWNGFPTAPGPLGVAAPAAPAAPAAAAAAGAAPAAGAAASAAPAAATTGGASGLAASVAPSQSLLGVSPQVAVADGSRGSAAGGSTAPQGAAANPAGPPRPGAAGDSVAAAPAANAPSSARSAVGDLWSGFGSTSRLPRSSGLQNLPANTGGPSQAALRVGMLAVGGVGALLAGFAVAEMRRRRATANAVD